MILLKGDAMIFRIIICCIVFLQSMIGFSSSVNVNELVRKGIDKYERGEFQDAINVLEEIDDSKLESFDKAKKYLYLGYAYIGACDDEKKTRENFEKALKINPNLKLGKRESKKQSLKYSFEQVARQILTDVSITSEPSGSRVEIESNNSVKIDTKTPFEGKLVSDKKYNIKLSKPEYEDYKTSVRPSKESIRIYRQLYPKNPELLEPIDLFVAFDVSLSLKYSEKLIKEIKERIGNTFVNDHALIFFFSQEPLTTLHYPNGPKTKDETLENDQLAKEKAKKEKREFFRRTNFTVLFNRIGEVLGNHRDRRKAIIVISDGLHDPDDKNPKVLTKIPDDLEKAIAELSTHNDKVPIFMIIRVDDVDNVNEKANRERTSQTWDAKLKEFGGGSFWYPGTNRDHAFKMIETLLGREERVYIEQDKDTNTNLKRLIKRETEVESHCTIYSNLKQDIKLKLDKNNLLYDI